MGSIFRNAFIGYTWPGTGAIEVVGVYVSFLKSLLGRAYDCMAMTHTQNWLGMAFLTIGVAYTPIPGDSIAFSKVGTVFNSLDRLAC